MMTVQKETRRLLTVNHVPLWQQDEYILQGYRPVSNSYLTSLKSWLYIHNQSINIYTHLLGFLFSLLTAYKFQDTIIARYKTATYEDTVVFLSFFFGVLACLGFSSAYHTFSNHSETICERWLILDYLGILCNIAASWVPGVYYGFYCERNVSRFYVMMILALSIICAIILLVPTLRTPKWKPFRTFMFLSLGLAGFFPMKYAATTFGISQAHLQMGWGWFILEAVCYISGAVIYAFKYPEKAWPGAFDIVGSSHQIFHVMVLLGAFSHFTGIVRAFEYNHNPKTRLCPPYAE